MNLDERSVNGGDEEQPENCRQELSLETIELLDVNELCGDDDDDAW